MRKFRIYGDNIIECERIAQLVLKRLGVKAAKTGLINHSTLVYKISLGKEILEFELLPGFNKSRRRRWKKDIFDVLKKAGSVLDETPDVVFTRIKGGEEEILLAIEFCSALQAGNQAWQRSGRAFSVGRTGCPYIYIVDFVKYELDSGTRERKSFRFPNPLAPYSYLIFSKRRGILTLQAYAKSEEFRPEGKLKDFPAWAFALEDATDFVIAKILEKPTKKLEDLLLEKNKAIANFLAGTKQLRLPDESLSFKKKIAKKSLTGHVGEVRDLGEKYGLGIYKDFPIGVIPASKRTKFTNELRRIYPSINNAISADLSQGTDDLIFCMIKGFKPGGDDDRPDRGILPLAMMLFPAKVKILTFIYGPLLNANHILLQTDRKALSMRSGFWNAILSLSDFIIIDSPIIGKHEEQGEVFISNMDFKADALKIKPDGRLVFPTFESTPIAYREEDVDTVINYLFAHLHKEKIFEGLCNPPGGDWSGLSLLVSRDREVRWLSLPRVSGEGKRPDHVIEIFRDFQKPVLLIIESKDKCASFEKEIGPKLVHYVKNLMNYIPNVEKIRDKWHKCEKGASADDFILVSGAAYLKRPDDSHIQTFEKTGCDMLFALEPSEKGWILEIHVIPGSGAGQYIKETLSSGVSEIEIK